MFWLNLPFVAGSVIAMALATPDSRDQTAGARLDVPGLLTSGLGLGALVLALVQGNAWGWTSTATLGSLVAGLVLLSAFCVLEQRGRAPLVDFRLFASRPYLGAAAAAFALVGSYYAIVFLVPQYSEFVLGHSAFRSGLLLLSITAPMAALSPPAGRLMGRLGARTLVTFGMACASAGMLAVTLVDADTGLRALVPGLLLFGVGFGLVYAPASVAGMAALPRDKAGIAAGVLAVIRLLGGTLQLAAGGALAQQVQSDRRTAGGSFESAFSDSLAATAGLLGAVLVAGTALTALLVRSPPAKPQPPPPL